MNTIGITVPAGSPTAIGLAIQFLRDVQEQQSAITEELQGPSILVAESAVAPIKPPVAEKVVPAEGGVVLDKDGLPWDARIHSDAAEKLSAKGVWKRKRNVSDELVAEVEAELRAGLAVGEQTPPTPAPVAEVAPTPPAPPAPPAAPAPVKVLQAKGGVDLDAYRAAGWTDQQLVDNGHAEWVEQAPVAPSTPPAPPAPPAASATASDDPTNWAGVANWVTKLQAGGVTLTPPELDAAAKSLGLTMLPELATRPELIPAFVAEIKRVKGL